MESGLNFPSTNYYAKGMNVTPDSNQNMMMRGVEKQNSKMKTSVMLGSFRDNQSTRMEFLSLISS